MSVGGGAPLGILVLLPVDVVDLGQGVVITILLPEDITQGFLHVLSELHFTTLCGQLCADHLSIVAGLSLPGENGMIGGDHTRAHLPTMAQEVAV